MTDYEILDSEKREWHETMYFCNHLNLKPNDYIMIKFIKYDTQKDKWLHSDICAVVEQSVLVLSVDGEKIRLLINGKEKITERTNNGLCF